MLSDVQYEELVRFSDGRSRAQPYNRVALHALWMAGHLTLASGSGLDDGVYVITDAGYVALRQYRMVHHMPEATDVG